MTRIVLTVIPALGSGATMCVPHGWSQWTRDAVLYRQYHHDDGSTTVLARMDETWFVLRHNGRGDLQWQLQSPQRPRAQAS